MHRGSLTWPCALALGLSAGCATFASDGTVPATATRVELTHESNPDAIHEAATLWMERRALNHDARAQTHLPRSYPEADGELGRHHYLYDAVLTLVWTTWTERDHAAAQIADELVTLQRDDGRWPDVLTTSGDAWVAGSMYPAGVTAWVAYALAYHGTRTEEARFIGSAGRAADSLMSTRITGPDGCGSLVRSRVDADPIAVTEHQLDTVQLLHALGRSESARSLLDDTLRCLWLEEQGRFATAAHPTRLVTDPALDAAGAWGALSLAADGRTEQAQASLRFTTDTFALSDGTYDGFRARLTDDVIFWEGSLGVALAAARLGRIEAAERTLSSVRDATIAHQGGVPYASDEAPGFSDTPAVASTLWFLFIDRELRSGHSAPVFEADATGQLATYRHDSTRTQGHP